MKMASGGVGIGLGVKDFRAIFVFDNNAVTVQLGIKLYKLTKNGLALQATVQGTKYWKDGDLN